MNKVDLSHFKNASKRLKEAFARWQLEAERNEEDELLLTMLCDSVTRRYKFTVEQAWKMMQRLLEMDSDSKTQEQARKGHRSVLRLAAENGWIRDYEQWNSFLDLHNDGSQNYDENFPVAILKTMPAFLPELTHTLAQLEQAAQSTS